MNGKDPQKLIQKHREEQDTRSQLAKDALNWFLDDKNVGQLYPRPDVVDEISESLDITIRQTNIAISATVGDIVDPVQQLSLSDSKYVGVIEYKQFNEEGAYGYVDIDDRKNERKRVVCARCVEKHRYDENVVHATQGEGTAAEDDSWSKLLDKITGHYANSHTTAPSSIEPGASLVSQTTIGGNTSIHLGNDGAGSGLVAEQLNGSLSGDLNLSGNAIVDNSQDFLDLTGGSDDLRLATGQAIEDGSGTERMSVDSDATRIYAEDGSIKFLGRGSNPTYLQAHQSSSVGIFDQVQNSVGVQYDTDPTAGVLRTPNASARIEANQVPSSDKGLELRFAPSVTRGIIRVADRGGSDPSELQVKADDVAIESLSGPVDLSDEPSDIRLATGQSIQDESGDKRLILNSGDTRIRTESDNGGLEASESRNGGTIVKAGGTGSLLIDASGSFSAIDYTTSASSPGTLELTNASLEAPNGVEVGQGSKLNFRDSADNFFGQIEMNESSSALEILASGNKKLSLQGDIIDMSLDAADIRLATGQAIEDGNGTERLEFTAGDTNLYNGHGNLGINLADSSHNFRGENGELAIKINDGAQTTLFAGSNRQIVFRDTEGTFDAVTYFTSASAPGTLELTNANLNFNNQVMNAGGNGVVNFNGIEFSRNIFDNEGLLIDARNETGNAKLTMMSNSGERPRFEAIDGGDLVAQDKNGNQTLLT